MAEKVLLTKKPKVPPVPVMNTVNRIRGGFGKVYRKMVPPQIAMFEMISAMWTTQAISVAARFGVADVIKDGEMSFQDVAARVNAHPESLYRLMRALTTAELFYETKLGHFKLTAYGRCLREDVPETVKAMAIFQGQYQWLHWSDLYHSVKTGEPSIQKTRGKSLFEFMATTPDAQKNFDLFMTSVSAMETAAVLDVYTFAEFKTVADIGGGHGRFLSAILEQNPSMKGILFDQPQVIAEAGRNFSSADLKSRCEIIAGDFYKSIPAGADAYVMKHIIHDWEESLCVQILKNIRAQIPASGKLILVETLVTAPNESHFSKMLDLEMLVNVGGKERTSAQYADLFAKCGFKLNRVLPTASMTSVIEAIPV